MHTIRIIRSCAARFALAGTILSFATACSLDSGQEQSPGENAPELGLAQQALLAEITTHEGAKYSFLQTGEGDITVAIEAPKLLDASQLPDANVNFVQFYERLAGRAAPDALVLAQTRATELAATAEGPKLEPLFDPGSVPGVTKNGTAEFVGQRSDALTGAQFTGMYCPGGYDFLYCWPNTAGNPWVQLSSVYLAGAISPIDCHIRFRYRYYDDGWKTLVDRIVGPGSHYWYYSSGSERSRRFEVLSNPAGCDLHFSVWGNY